MRLPASPFEVTDWTSVEPELHPGETGTATWRTLTMGDVRIRPRRLQAPATSADHWCASRPRPLCVLAGEIDTELKDGRTFRMTAGMSYRVSDHGDAAHRSSTRVGAQLFIVD